MRMLYTSVSYISDPVVYFLIVSAIIKIIILMTIHCNKQLSSPNGGAYYNASFIMFILLSGLTLYHFINSIYEGPGYLPYNWVPVSRKTKLLATSFVHLHSILCIVLRRNTKGIANIYNFVLSAKDTKLHDPIIVENVRQYVNLCIIPYYMCTI